MKLGVLHLLDTYMLSYELFLGEIKGNFYSLNLNFKAIASKSELFFSQVQRLGWRGSECCSRHRSWHERRVQCDKISWTLVQTDQVLGPGWSGVIRVSGEILDVNVTHPLSCKNCLQ